VDLTWRSEKNINFGADLIWRKRKKFNLAILRQLRQI